MHARFALRHWERHTKPPNSDDGEIVYVPNVWHVPICQALNSHEGVKQPSNDPLKEELLEEMYDKIVFCVLADMFKKLLGNQTQWIEKKDLDYKKRWYKLEYNEEVAVSDFSGRNKSRRVEKAKEMFQP
ncbi:hypothetical protein F5876DRAFT_70048 [Lentinula aff. lateritia]|uniref:Uncharacterized protein n=1 Tax=Lentinula aff. lateritia TaxID=2804960 RepID=A0ACC1TKK9_9AGAR|nr:hypothetical protein F5876DRAFT_70048 [Lentinula aff. lateritia]